MNFLPQLVAQFKNVLTTEYELRGVDRLSYSAILHLLEHKDCKRLLFNAQQALLFDQVGPFDLTKKNKVHSPFSFFYLEFTAPLNVHCKEPGHTDLLRGVLYSEREDKVTEWLNAEVKREIPVTKVTFFFKSERDEFVDRTWSLSPEGYPLIGRLRGTVIKQRSRQQIKEWGKEGEGSFIHESNVPEWVREGTMTSVKNAVNVGWWEESIMALSDLLYWIFAYTMAKSVKIVEIPVSRQVRRAMERQQKVPQPWHVVRVEPQTVKDKTEYVGAKNNPCPFRYDVIGFLRKNKHLLKDGTYRETIEWVSEHQRGIHNELYIPKTYLIEGGKKIDTKTMKQYINES